MSTRRFQLDDQLHRLGEEVELPYQVVRALGWWVASELVRRHPDTLRVIETHPSGGQYDCLSLYRREEGNALFAHLNLLGHVTPAVWFESDVDETETRPNWFEVLATGDRSTYVIEQLELVGDLPSPVGTPATTRRSIGPRLISRFATSTSLGRRVWHIRNGVYDSSGDGGGVNEWVRDIPGVSLEPLPTDLLGEPAYRLWYVLDHNDRPFTAIDVDLGIGWRRDADGTTFDLMDIYASHAQRLDAAGREVLPDIE